MMSSDPELSTKKVGDEGRNLREIRVRLTVSAVELLDSRVRWQMSDRAKPSRWCLVGFFRPFSDCASPPNGLRTKRKKRYKGPTARTRIYACVCANPCIFIFFIYICKNYLLWLHLLLLLMSLCLLVLL